MEYIKITITIWYISNLYNLVHQLYINFKTKKNTDFSEGCPDNEFLVKKPHIHLLNQIILSLVLGYKFKLTFQC